MKRSASWLAVGAVALLLPVAANAACTNLADKVNCKSQQKCIATVATTGSSYAQAVLKASATLIQNSQAGKLNKAPILLCQGGGKAFAGKACHTNADCGTGECAPATGKNAGSADYEKAKATALKNLYAACMGKCDKSGLPCYTLSDCGATDTTCKTSGQATGVTTAAQAGLGNLEICVANKTIDPLDTDVHQFQGLVNCIDQSVVGLTHNGVLDTTGATLGSPSSADSIVVQLNKANGASTLIRPKSTTGADPAMIAQMSGTTMLQIGNGISGNDKDQVSGGGGVTYGSLGAHCSITTTQKCVSDADCPQKPSAETCTASTNCGASDAVCTSGAANCCVSHSISPPNNTLTVTGTCSETSVPPLADCLHTTLGNVGDGNASIATIDLATGAYASLAPIKTTVLVTGTLFPSGTCASYHACPICRTKKCVGNCINATTGVPVAGPLECSSSGDCPSPGTNVCTVDTLDFTAGNSTACTTADNTSTIECVPNEALSFNQGAIPNPFRTGTGTVTMNPSTSGNVVGPRNFCGHCDTAQGPGCVSTDDSLCAIGCQADAECGGGNQCNFADTIDGFEGDTTVASIESHGSPSIYSPINTGVFCTGITSST
ncbi:MAG TPA: hypothetical protein VMW17_15790, partial [Candidatus Binatia bacterium]|nr:hypothetical protein [Candidatus Binatia bacterium]